MDRSEILHAAEECVCGQREQDYGSPEDNFNLIAALWTEYLGAQSVPRGGDCCITATDVAMMMALLKIARVATSLCPAEDSFVDLAGYAACGGEIASLREVSV